MILMGGFWATHCPDLDRAGVSAQNLGGVTKLWVEEEGVMGFPGRVAFRKIQGREIVPVVLNVRPLCHTEAHVTKYGGEFFEDLHHRVESANWLQGGVARTGLSFRSPDGHQGRLLPGPFCGVRSLLRPLFLTHSAEDPFPVSAWESCPPSCFIRPEMRPFLPKLCDADFIQSSKIFHSCYRRQNIRSKGFDICHMVPRWCSPTGALTPPDWSI